MRRTISQLQQCVVIRGTVGATVLDDLGSEPLQYVGMKRQKVAGVGDKHSSLDPDNTFSRMVKETRESETTQLSLWRREACLVADRE